LLLVADREVALPGADELQRRGRVGGSPDRDVEARPGVEAGVAGVVEADVVRVGRPVEGERQLLPARAGGRSEGEERRERGEQGESTHGFCPPLARGRGGARRG